MKTQAKKTETNPKQMDFQKETYLMVPPSTIIVDEKKNPRLEYGEIEELMLSIVENGIRNPLKGYEKDGKIILKDGFRRMRAIKLALVKGKKIERIPLILEKQPLNEEERTLEFMIYNDGKPLTMLEQSEVIRRLINFGWKVTDIVKKTGKARGYIENLILLNRTTMKVHHHVKEGKISANAVVQIMQAVKGDAEKAAREVENAITKAKESGKEKATPKHVGTKQVRSQSFGKFYKWAEEIADTIAGKKEAIKQREEVLTNLLVYFENGKKPIKVAEDYFIEKKKA
ncbi:MAG: ParB/RepB/Spo0J family partition protein [Bacteroidales bacterium]|jgi:ParB/RepB/Spo0J family partition protein